MPCTGSQKNSYIVREMSFVYGRIYVIYIYIYICPHYLAVLIIINKHKTVIFSFMLYLNLNKRVIYEYMYIIDNIHENIIVLHCI